MNIFCTIGEAVEEIKAQGANISIKELRRIAREADLPFRQGAGRALLYRSSDLMSAFENSFQRPSEIIVMARARQRKRYA
jgi:hypothetical protein|nr:MAG TPA: hypothetical protein [Caudoviricetes sp.]